MTNISTGVVEGRFSRKKPGQDRDDGDNEDYNFQMDAYNSGLFFGSVPELAAFRLNQQHERRLLSLCKRLESERSQVLRDLSARRNLVLRRKESLNELRCEFVTFLEPEHYKQLSRLFQEGRLKPLRKTFPRVSSAKVIAEKARQLKLGSANGQRSAPLIHSPISTQGHQIPTSRKSIIRLHETYGEVPESDTVVTVGDGGKVRITVADQAKKTTPLQLQLSIRGAISVGHPKQMTAEYFGLMTLEEGRDNIHPLEINLQALGAEYVTTPAPPSRGPKIRSVTSPAGLLSHPRVRQRCLSAHPTLGSQQPEPPASKTSIQDQRRKYPQHLKTVETFCRSAFGTS